MSSLQYLMVFDLGTTSIRCCLMNCDGQIVASAQEKFEQFYPQAGWVEHDPLEWWQVCQTVAQAALAKQNCTWQDIAIIGLTNQRETVIAWDSETGTPLHPAIVWQCRRTSETCDALKAAGHAEWVQAKTGLVLDPYFSASKIQWLFQNVPAVQATHAQGKLKVGTVDSWILWLLSGKSLHVSDHTNASRTLLYNIHTDQWDPDLLALFDIPENILPKICPSNHIIGHSDPSLTDGKAIPLGGIIGDQQAALYGQQCWQPGSAKSTYGTGAFLMMNLGDKSVISKQGLLTTRACDAWGNPSYAFEGAIFMAGATLEWLQNQLNCFQSGKEADELALSLEDNDGVYLIPAMAGLGAPHWRADARGQIVGLSQKAGRAHLARAAMEAMGYQTKEVLGCMQDESSITLAELRIDGGVSRSPFLSQFLADLLKVSILRSPNAESTALGAGYLAGLAAGIWASPDALKALNPITQTFQPERSYEVQLAQWQQYLKQMLA